MPRRFVLTLVALLALASVLRIAGGSARAQAADADVAAARAVLEAQQAAWNRGDVAGYMEGYAQEASTTFISGDTLTRGWKPVLDRYKARYDTREKMGTLTFSDLEFQRLSDQYILATGRWQLTLKSDTPHGRFTLIFRRTAAGWRVVHDHTSSAS